MSSQLKFILKLVFSLALLVFVFSTTGIEKTLKELSTANLWYVPVCVLVYVLGQLASSYRWKLLAGALGFRLAYREFVDYYMMGMYFSLFLPSAIGGDVGKMFYLAKSAGRKKREAGLTVLAERASGLAALVFMASLVCLTPMADALPVEIRYGVIGLLVVGVLGLFVLRALPIQKVVDKFPKMAFLLQARVYWSDLPLLLKTTGVSLVVHMMMVVIHVLIARALGLHFEGLQGAGYLAVVYCVVSLISVLPVTFNGIGLRDFSYQYLLGKAGVSAHEALAFAMYWFVVSALTSLLGGLVLVKGHYKTPSTQEMGEEPVGV